jgi:predicted transcriptional regulator
MALAEETHYPEDDFVVNELIKTLSKQSREFAKTYKEFMDQVKDQINK